MKIDKIEIKNFKSLKNINLTLGNLTLITGINSSGKSSLIQTLLLLKENENIRNIEELKLPNNIQSILYQEHNRVNDYISIALMSENVLLELVFGKKENYNFKDKNKINLFCNSFQYLETNRVPPKNIYEMSIEHLKNDLLGIRGEYTAHYLNQNRNNKINISKLKHSDAITDRLIENVSLWLSEISNGIEISTNIYPELGQVRLSYSYNYGGKRTNSYTPLNVGFGITFVLPIIVAILKAKPDDLLIIENPESHLHPKAQSKIAELCAIASAKGIQIIVETHSDHFLNGIRVATKNELLKPEDSKVYFFRKEQDELETKIDEIHINKDGGIDKYPKGFFDQFDDDLDELLGL